MTQLYFLEGRGSERVLEQSKCWGGKISPRSGIPLFALGVSFRPVCKLLGT